MTAPSQGQTAKDQTTERESALIARLVAAGYVRAEPSILQPAAVFLDQSGEDIRGRIYLTTDASGAEYCLRPEYTIPVCRDYLASSTAGKPAAFSYLGPVFRYRPAGPVEFNQAGLESFGRSDREAADAEIFTVALEAARAAHAGPLTVRIGDTGLFTRLLDILDLPPVWLRRIRRGHARGQTLDALFALPENGNGGDHSGVLAALEGTDKKGARALVEDLLSIAGISSISGRTPGEIAERFLEQASLKAGSALAAEKRVIFERYLTIAGNPDDAARQLRALADDTKLDLTAALDAFEARLGFIAARGFDVGDLQFSARFGRNLDYYTGFVFEAQDRSRTDNRPIVGGGRYDGLLKTLGASADIPAVGAAIWCDRLDVVGASA